MRKLEKAFERKSWFHHTILELKKENERKIAYLKGKLGDTYDTYYNTSIDRLKDFNRQLKIRMKVEMGVIR